MKIDKKELIQAINVELNNIRDIAVASAKQAHDAATHTENIAESRYDTLGLEAAYLAHGQTQRVVDCESDIDAFKHLDSIELSEGDEIGVGALVCIKADDQSQQYLFLAPSSGGVKILFNGIEVTLVTGSSPIGKALLGKCIDDDIKLIIKGQSKYFQVVGVY